jgi:hypothetical protein
MSARYDFSQPDEQPGLSRLIWRNLRGSDPPWEPPAALPGAGDGDGDE